MSSPSSRSGSISSSTSSSWCSDVDESDFVESCRCLFCPLELGRVEDAEEHMFQQHSKFKFKHVAQALQLNFYQQIQLINWIRTQIKNGESSSSLESVLCSPDLSVSSTPSMLSWLWLLPDERVCAASESGGCEEPPPPFMQPVMQDDALLFSLPKQNKPLRAGTHSSNVPINPSESKAADPDSDSDSEEGEEDDLPPLSSLNNSSSTNASQCSPSSSALLAEVLELRAQVCSMRDALHRVAFSDESGSAAQGQLQHKAEEKSNSLPSAHDSSIARIDNDYFGGYSVRNIHELMLRDTVRTEAYRDFMYANSELFRDKVVLDVGCGSAILSLFAAKAGAKLVIGVDAANIVHKAREIVKANGYSDKIVIVHGKMEEVQLPVDKVDIIISEWMGYFLLFESMLPSVLYARDKYLRNPPHQLSNQTGVYPNQARMFLCGMEASVRRNETIEYWKNVYGFDMSCMIEQRDLHLGSTVEIVRPEWLITDTCCLKQFDCLTVTTQQLDFEADFQIQVTKQQQLDAFVVYFDTLFTHHCVSPITLSTAPVSCRSPLPELTTHWQQTVFHLTRPVQVQVGHTINGKLTATRLKHNPRAYHVVIQYSVPAIQSTVYVQEYDIE